MHLYAVFTVVIYFVEFLTFFGFFELIGFYFLNFFPVTECCIKSREVYFLPRNAPGSRFCTVMRLHVVRPSVTIRYRGQIGWNSSKIISGPNSLRPMRSLMPNMDDLVQREHPQN